MLTRYQKWLLRYFPKTITCVKAEAPVKTQGDIDEGLEAYTDVDTINEFEAVALVDPKAYIFS